MTELNNFEENLQEKIEIFESKTNLNFNQFYNKYINKLIYYNYKICKDFQQAEDLAQDAIIKAISIIDDYDSSKSKFSTWLYTISKNDSLQAIKKKPLTTSVDLGGGGDVTTKLDYMHTNEDEDKQELQIRDLNHQKGTLLMKYLPKIKEPYRTILDLRETQKFSYRKISIILKERCKTAIDLTKMNFVIANSNSFDLLLVDPEIKKDNELAKFCDIDDIFDIEGNKINYEILEYDKDELITKIRLHIKDNKITIKGSVPYNLSTLKSRIRSGRSILQKMVRQEFKDLEQKYLE